MANEDVPKRRASDPVPGTKGPQRGNTDAFKVKDALERKTEPPPKPDPVEGSFGRIRRETLKEIEESTLRGDKPKPFKKGGMVRGWGKARKKGC